MATYMFEALNNAGEEVKDEIDAQSTEDAIARIREMGYYPTRVKEKAKAEKAEVKDSAAVLPDNLKWLEKIKISGDFRYRHEHIDSQRAVDGNAEWRSGRDRDRIRARLKVSANVNDEWDVVFRMATGQYEFFDDTLLADTVSTNQTLTNFGSRLCPRTTNWLWTIVALRAASVTCITSRCVASPRSSGGENRRDAGCTPAPAEACRCRPTPSPEWGRRSGARRSRRLVRRWSSRVPPRSTCAFRPR